MGYNGGNGQNVTEKVSTRVGDSCGFDGDCCYSSGFEPGMDL